MPVERVIIEGRSALICEYEDDVLKIIFDDGETMFVVPSPQSESNETPNQPNNE